MTNKLILAEQLIITDNIIEGYVNSLTEFAKFIQIQYVKIKVLNPIELIEIVKARALQIYNIHNI